MAGLAERIPDEPIFVLLLDLFRALGQGVAPELCGLWGQERLLGLLGLAPEFDRCLGCGSEAVAGYSASEGGVLCSSCYAGSGFAVSPSTLALCRALRATPVEGFDARLGRDVVKGAGLIYREHFLAHLGLSPKLFRRVVPKMGEMD